jgi:hypothetical protein
MPGSVLNAVSAGVLPYSLSKAFAHSREYLVLVNDYANGESQRSLVTFSSRKRWPLTKRLAYSTMATLRAFYDSMDGPLKAFYFYDVFETSPKFSYDVTGVATTGRYIVHFDSEFSTLWDLGRNEVDVQLVEGA